jgi:hypothetical protein
MTNVESNIVHMRELIHDLLSLQSTIEKHEAVKTYPAQHWRETKLAALKAQFDTALAEHDACAGELTNQQYVRAAKWAKSQLENDNIDESW